VTKPHVSPDAPAGIRTIVAAAARRGRLVALAEAAAWGVAAMAISPAAGVLVAAVIAIWRWRATRRNAIVRALERAQPAARNLFVTADELERDVLGVKPAIRARVLADAGSMGRNVELRALFPAAPIARAVLAGAAAWTLAAAIPRWRPAGNRDAAGAISQAPSSPNPGGPAMRVTVTVQPPRYTALPAATMVDPEQIQAIEGTTALLRIESESRAVTLEQDGQVRALERSDNASFTGRVALTRTGYLLVAAGDDARRTMPVVVIADALPAVRLAAPGRDLVYSGGNPRIAFEAHATDDVGLRSLALRYTIVSGSGEQVDFKDGEIPLVVTPRSSRDWTGSASRALAGFNLKEGDMLVYRAVASDARPGGGTASSDAFFIELSRLGVAAGDAFTLPQEETRYALSQQMLIVKTGKLHQRRGTMPREQLIDAALGLAVEQRMIRAEFVFMLGGEVEDEEVEAAQSTELQAGRLENRGQRDVRAATIAMSQAEKALTGADTAAALVAERAAVAALQRALSRERYLLRALAQRSRLDPARRLTGNLSDAADWRRTPAALPEDRRVALLQEVLRGIAGLTASADAGVPFRQRARLLAQEAIRIAAASPRLRQAATALQRAADGAGDPAVRQAALAEAAAATSSEAREFFAAAPAALVPLAPALGGAFADALRLDARPETAASRSRRAPSRTRGSR
jgi:hypothetical protein